LAKKRGESKALSPAPGKSWQSNRHAGYGDKIFSNLTLFFTIIMLGILVALVFVLARDAMPAINKFGFSFFSSSAWNPVKDVYGALPAIYGTLLSSLIGLIIAVPISLGAAIFLVELAPNWLQGPASFVIEMLAAIPSVIIGLWGLYVLVPVVRNPIERWLGHLTSLPFFQGPPFGVGFLAAGLILAIMIIPIITAITRDAMRAVPNEQREAMLALGATRWETINKAVLPYCRTGTVGAIILGLGRALGETMAVTMVIGNSYKVTASLFSPGATIASTIASQFGEASTGVYTGSLIELALILFGITLIVNIVARTLVWRMTSLKAGKQ
jgi:phosphate transport system permease protein